MTISYFKEIPKEKKYFHLFNSTGWNENYRLDSKELINSLQNSQFCISAYSDGELVGFGRMLTDYIAHAVVFDAIVLPEFMGNGIGKKIMKMLIEECKKLKIRDIQLFCARGKIGFYKKLGFQERAEDAPGMEIRIKY